MATLPQMTLAELRLAAQQRADMVGSQFVSDAEWSSYINSSYFELYDLLVQKYGDDYFVASPYQVTTDGQSDRYALPSDFYKLLGVDLQNTGTPNGWLTLRPFTFTERNRNSITDTTTWAGRTNLRYRLNGSNVWFTPMPQSGMLMRLWYVPRLTPLTSDTDVADGVSGWLEYVVVDAAIKAMQKEESDVSVLLAQKGALIRRIESAAENRDAGSPARVADVQRLDWAWGGYRGDPFGEG